MSSSRAAWTSATTTCTWAEPGSDSLRPMPKAIEQAEPGGVHWRRAEQGVDLRRRLDVRAGVGVEGDAHAERGAVPGELGQPLPDARPGAGREAVRRRHPPGDRPPVGVAGVGGHQRRALQLAEQPGPYGVEGGGSGLGALDDLDVLHAATVLLTRSVVKRLVRHPGLARTDPQRPPSWVPEAPLPPRPAAVSSRRSAPANAPRTSAAGRSAPSIPTP